ncbi:hypothetical protein [Paractinoplanes abujensis]|uniref:Uncharacterized protein n=1 Tax=Paractinoplanes abujensis TaxID=882441 RepID=A0A7W7CXZ0_9ACTN|nr:hypothetical protein [Actinoplanes abujensis]MBB4696687.1 hypothetical protein [Actinoplanes abujensis]
MSFAITGTARADEPGAPPAVTASPAPAAAAAECTKLEPGRFGPLAAEQINTVIVPPGGTGCTEVHLPAGRYFLQVRGAGVNHNGWVFRPDESRLCPFGAGTLWDCTVSTEGDYQVRIGNRSATDTMTYRIAAVRQDPADCTTRVSTAWDAASVRLPQSDDLEAHCVRFSATNGESIFGFAETGIAYIRDLNNVGVCTFPSRYNPPCQIRAASGDFVAMTLAPADSADDEIQIRSLTSRAGCPELTPGLPGDPTPDAFSGIRCRTIHVPAPGKYLITNVAQTGEPRRLIALEGNERIHTSACARGYTIPADGLCEFTKAGTFILVADGDTSSLVQDRPYAVTFTHYEPFPCQEVGVYGLPEAAQKGTFTRAGEVHCYEFTRADPDAVDIYFPPSTTEAERPEYQLVASPRPGYTRVMFTARSAGEYKFVLQTKRIMANCQPWTEEVLAEFDADHITRCFRMPQYIDAAQLTTTIEKVSGSGALEVHVNRDGYNICTGNDTEFTCATGDREAPTLVLVGDPVPTSYRITRTPTTPVS